MTKRAEDRHFACQNVIGSNFFLFSKNV